ncbi:hypothetical protein SCP_1202960 [Sparassis crispa]|uniref:SHSP domain-containing protein n=1 Tax=Sparassis crispa TaxID=139825 RepID=A0A401H0W0_9APHY|nr:hypothetical protein SCP_1202960 [Sparassis crispa]GBE88067.1 hypothetical protein SCP_1202960 [Sparassis crispa]
MSLSKATRIRSLTNPRNAFRNLSSTFCLHGPTHSEARPGTLDVGGLSSAVKIASKGKAQMAALGHGMASALPRADPSMLMRHPAVLLGTTPSSESAADTSSGTSRVVSGVLSPVPRIGPSHVQLRPQLGVKRTIERIPSGILVPSCDVNASISHNGSLASLSAPLSLPPSISLTSVDLEIALTRVAQVTVLRSALASVPSALDIRSANLYRQAPDISQVPPQPDTLRMSTIGFSPEVLVVITPTAYDFKIELPGIQHGAVQVHTTSERASVVVDARLVRLRKNPTWKWEIMGFAYAYLSETKVKVDNGTILIQVPHLPTLRPQLLPPPRVHVRERPSEWSSN